MFSVRQKREIANKVQQILRETGHPELPEGEIGFHLHVDGAESWSWADIRNNGAVINPGLNLHNEAQDRGHNVELTGARGPASEDQSRVFGRPG